MKLSPILLFSALTSVALGSGQPSFDSFVPYTENFNDFRGTEATLPAGFSITAGGTNIFRGEFNSGTNNAADFTGIMAATSDGVNYALVWRESTGNASLDDARILLAITNNTGSPIYGFEVSYDLQAWVNGRRDNELRFKYDIYPDSDAAPLRSAFETDIWTRNTVRTRNPNHTPIASNGNQFVLNGHVEGNFVNVSGSIDLTSLLIDETDPAAGVFGPLEDGETAYFRWQISNNQLTDGNRSALGIDNLSITPLATPPPSAPVLEWKPGVGGDGDWTPTGGTNWNDGDQDGEWQQEATAVFGGTPGTVTLDGAIEATDIILTSGYTLDAEQGSTVYVEGLINVADSVTATLAAPIRTDGFLRKQGNGTLLLSSPQTHTGPTSIFAGTLRTTVDHAHSPNAAMTITPGAVFDLDGTTQTIAGLNGQRDGLVLLGNGGTLIFDIPSGSFAYRADLEGDGNVIKRGAGTQRFRSENKTYTGFTRIEEGTLEVTGNGEMTDTSAIEVMPAGELFFVGDSSSGPPAEFGAPISLMGGRLAFQNTNEEALYFVDTEVQILEDNSTINVSGAESIAIFDTGFGGQITGDALFRKTGAGTMEIEGNHSHTGGMEVRNGSVVFVSGSSLGAGPLRFTTSDVRSLELQNNGLTVTLLDGSASDPEEEDAENNLFLTISSGATLTVNQPILFDEEEEDEEVSTRFQGAIEGAGNFVKAGDGFLRLTRWAKTYSGSTTIQQGVLAVSESAALASTSGITVQDGGQLRLTSSGENVSYQFGGDLSLAGLGRSGNVTAGSGQGIGGALRYEPGNDDNTATVANAITVDSALGVVLHVSGSSNTLILEGNLSGGGTEPITKSGGGILRLDAANGSLSKPWFVANGTLEVPAGSSSGSGTLTVEEGGVLVGRGSVGGNLLLAGELDLGTAAGALSVNGNFTLLEGGALLLELPVSAARLSVTGEAVGSDEASIVLSGTIEAGSYPVLTAADGTAGGEPVVVGVPEGLTASLVFNDDDDTLYLVLSSGGGFGGWVNDFDLPEADREPLATPAGDGVTNLLKYALGVAPLAPANNVMPAAGLMEIADEPHLTFEAVVRADDPDLTVTAEGSLNLTDWNLPLVELVGVDQTGVADGFVRRAWRTEDPVGSAAAFMRLRATLAD